MIFENAYGAWLKGLFNENIRKIKSEAVVKLYQEIVYKPLYKNQNEIALIINGGNAARSTVSGLDQNVMPFSITILCRAENKNAVRNAMDYVQEHFNAVPMELIYEDNVTGNECTVKTKSIFNTPMVLDERDHPTKTETIKISILQMTASVTYGKNAFINPIKWKLEVDGTVYPIDHIASYNLASSPAYDEYQGQGDCFIQRNFLARSLAYSFSIYRLGTSNTFAPLKRLYFNCPDKTVTDSILSELSYNLFYEYWVYYADTNNLMTIQKSTTGNYNIHMKVNGVGTYIYRSSTGWNVPESGYIDVNTPPLLSTTKVNSMPYNVGLQNKLLTPLFNIPQTFQDVLDNELACKEDGLSGKELKLIAYSNPYDDTIYDEIPITKHSLVETYVNNASAYQLTLAR